MNDEQIKHMVDRFLGWPLPENFNPDGGVSFRRFGNEGTAHEYRNNPTGTNLLDYAQATEMVRYMVDGLSPAFPVSLLAEYRATHKDCKDLTGHPDALPSQRRDWRCDLCKQADEYTQPPSPNPSAKQAAPADIEAEGNGWPAGWCSSCDRMTSRGCVISGRPACDTCGDWLIFNGVQMPPLADQAPMDGVRGTAQEAIARLEEIFTELQEPNSATHDAWDWMDAHFQLEVLKSVLAASPAPIPVSPSLASFIGQKVRVKHERYSGIGILKRVDPVRGAIAWVELAHGEDRWYEAETVLPLEYQQIPSECQRVPVSTDPRVQSMTYGDLVKAAPAAAHLVEPHEWDNKNISEQRDWAIQTLERKFQDRLISDVKQTLAALPDPRVEKMRHRMQVGQLTWSREEVRYLLDRLKEGR